MEHGGSPRGAGTHGVTCISVLRETDTDGQASGGSDSGDWIFTIREKDPKSLENGALQPSDLERNKAFISQVLSTRGSAVQFSIACVHAGCRFLALWCLSTGRGICRDPAPSRLPLSWEGRSHRRRLKEKSQACGGNLGSIEELRGAIYLAEEACPGISDTMVAQLVQRLQRGHQSTVAIADTSDPFCS
ncbi:Serine/threonine-protein kinase 24, partial [Eschrichtius robustus]|nr:Serine/threonine-protein kinase 24 [Eschrichtius robustus]